MHYRHGRKEQPAACRLEKTPGGCDRLDTGGGGGGHGAGKMLYYLSAALISLSPTLH